MKKKNLTSLFQRTASLILAGTIAVGLSACGSSSSTSTASSAAAQSTAAAGDTIAAAQTKEPAAASAASTTDAAAADSDTTGDVDTSEENTIRFADNPGTIRYAIVILADQLGYYKDEGVNVEFPAIQDNQAALTAITTGKDEVDVLGTGIVPDLAFIAGGSDLVVFEGTAAEGGAIISRPEDVEKYKDLKNLQNIKVALKRNESAWVWTRIAMQQQGLDPDTMELFEVDSEADVAQAVAKGEAEVGFLPEEFVSSYKDLGIEEVTAVGNLEPQYVCCRQVTSQAKLDAKRDAFVKFTKANLKAWKYYEDPANREAIDEALSKFSGQTTDYVDNYLFVNKTTLTLDPNTKGIEDLYAELQKTGVIDKNDVNIDDHIDTSVYKDALDQLVQENPNDDYYQQKEELFQQYNT